MSRMHTRSTAKQSATATTVPSIPSSQPISSGSAAVRSGTQNEVIANFFQSLLTKKAPETNSGDSISKE